MKLTTEDVVARFSDHQRPYRGDNEGAREDADIINGLYEIFRRTISNHNNKADYSGLMWILGRREIIVIRRAARDMVHGIYFDPNEHRNYIFGIAAMECRCDSFAMIVMEAK